MKLQVPVNNNENSTVSQMTLCKANLLDIGQYTAQKAQQCEMIMSLRHLVISLYVSSSSDCDYKVYYHNDEVWYQGSNRQYRCIVSDNSLVLTRRRAIIWTVSAQMVFPQERIMLPVSVFVFWACMLNDTICHMIHTTGNIYQPSYVTWVTRWITDITGYYSVLSGVSGR